MSDKKMMRKSDYSISLKNVEINNLLKCSTLLFATMYV